MHARQIGIWLFATAVVAGGTFLVGQRMRESDTRLADESMTTFMSTYSALAYLDKGDLRSATLTLRDLAERNVITVHKLGNPQLESVRPGATRKWFAEYAALREKLPSHPKSVGGEGFEQEVDAILAAAVKDAVKTPKN